MTNCTICQAEISNKDDAKHLPLYVIGSEGIMTCLECRMALTHYAEDMMRLAGKSRMAGYKMCKEMRDAKSSNTRPHTHTDNFIADRVWAEAERQADIETMKRKLEGGGK